MLRYNVDDVENLLEQWTQLKTCSKVNNFKFALECQRHKDTIDKLAHTLRQLVFDDANPASISKMCSEFEDLTSEYSKLITIEILKNGPILKSVPKSPP
jgi:hypothetical protein